MHIGPAVHYYAGHNYIIVQELWKKVFTSDVISPNHNASHRYVHVHVCKLDYNVL